MARDLDEWTSDIVGELCDGYVVRSVYMGHGQVRDATEHADSSGMVGGQMFPHVCRSTTVYTVSRGGLCDAYASWSVQAQVRAATEPDGAEHDGASHAHP